jgi:hypothetical protein
MPLYKSIRESGHRSPGAKPAAGGVGAVVTTPPAQLDSELDTSALDELRHDIEQKLSEIFQVTQRSEPMSSNSDIVLTESERAEIMAARSASSPCLKYTWP